MRQLSFNLNILLTLRGRFALRSYCEEWDEIKGFYNCGTLENTGPKTVVPLEIHKNDEYVWLDIPDWFLSGPTPHDILEGIREQHDYSGWLTKRTLPGLCLGIRISLRNSTRCKIATGEITMPNKTASIISGLLTAIILILLAILSVFIQLVALNGVGEQQGLNAMSISLICQGLSLSLAIILARWLTNLLMVKFNLNTVLAIIIAVIVAAGLGGLVSFLSIIVAIPLVGIR